jgi:hypothetical protein
MRPAHVPATFRTVTLLALAATALGNAGCLVVAAGAAAAGGVAGYAYYKGSVPREYAATFEQTWAAAQAAFADLGVAVDGIEHNGGSGTLEGRTPDGTRVDAVVESVTAGTAEAAPQTRVSVRVGVFGDQPVSDRLLDQIQVRLTTPGGAGPAPATGEPPAACQRSPIVLPAETAPPPLLETDKK